MDQIDIERLIEDVKKLNRDCESRRRSVGGDFNIFYVIATESDEVRICRLIKELLDPKGCHGQGSIFLKSFVEIVLQSSPDDFRQIDYLNAVVTREEVIDSFRRIDICIRIGTRFIPIEVKIYADDQERQCRDYYDFAVKRDKDTTIYYLTLDGHEPDESSRGDLTDEQLRCISFGEHILQWIEACIKLPELERLSNIREILMQFRDVVRKLTGQDQDEVKMEIENIIISSPENYHAAKLVADTLPQIQADKMCEVFRAIEKHMAEKGFTECYANYAEKARSFYSDHKKTWPSLNYIIRPVNAEITQTFVLKFEIDWRLYYGVCLWDEGNKDNSLKINRNDSNAEYVLNMLSPKTANKSTASWYWWKYAMDDERLDFRNCDETYDMLYSKSGFDDVMNLIFRNIDSVLDENGLIDRMRYLA